MAENVTFTFLGTGSSVPTARRNHQAFSLRFKGEHLLFDCGEGTQRQFRYAKLNPCSLTRIFISHWHADHVLGLPGLLMTLSTNGYVGTLEIHGPRGTRRHIEQLTDMYLRGMGLGGEENAFDIRVIEHSGGVAVETDEFVIESMLVDHGTTCLAYSFTVKEKTRLDKNKLAKLNVRGPTVGKLAKGEVIEINGKKVDGKKLLYVEPARKIVIVSDTSYMKELGAFSKGAELLVIESSFSKDEAETAKQYKHLTSELCAKIAKAGKVNTLALVHLSQRYDAVPKILKKEAEAVFTSGKVVVPKDLDVVVV